MPKNQYLLVDKPEGWTSFDVVAKIRGILRAQGDKKAKVGHAGTLDPLATGLLIVLVGNECKKQNEYMKLDKTYEVKMKLGETSTTDDGEGELSKVNDNEPNIAEVDSVIQAFIGDISQVPPIYSAIKVDGKRAYKLARQGKQVEIKPRTVTIHSITNVIYKYPEISFTTSVGSGTYIRSLVRDIGKKLGTGAYMTDLKRSTIGQYKLSDAHKIDSLETILEQPNRSELKNLLREQMKYASILERMITKEKKQAVVKDLARSKNDTGSSAVQVGILTSRIEEITAHLKTNGLLAGAG